MLTVKTRLLNKDSEALILGYCCAPKESQTGTSLLKSDEISDNIKEETWK